ncbi:DUF2235 domain-containing protein [Pseudomonadota bacterium]
MKRIILCADGTGNQGGVTPDTNVFRIFNDVAKKDKNGIKQITYYDKGVGTSSNKILGGITGAFGFGLKRNIRDLYEFLARNYNHGDEIYLFGFSRGAATARAFAGMVQACGLISLYTNADGDPDKRQRKLESKFQKEINEAMEFYVNNGVKSKTSLDVAPPENLTQSWGNTYLPSSKVPIKFIGVWDTVSALGFPKDWSWIFNRFFYALDKASDFVWHHTFYNYQLSEQVENVYHALALDDERRTFHPRVWREEKNPSSIENFLRPQHIEQVWFSGVHSNVGGGYARDGLSFVTLDWMIKRAVVHGLAFKEGVEEAALQDANVHGKFYDSRAGLGIYYRYAPRNIKALCLDTHRVKADSIKIHESVFDRMRQVTENYAPGQLPFRFQIVSSEVDAKARDCQAAKDQQTWNEITENIAKPVDYRRGLYTIFAESSMLVFLFSWYFWVLTPGLEFSGDGDLVRHIADIFQYVVPQFMEGLVTYAVSKYSLIGLSFAAYVYVLYKIRTCLKHQTDFFCRQARDHLINQEPSASNDEWLDSVKTTNQRHKFFLVEGGGLALALFSLLLIVANIFATVQSDRTRNCGDFSGQVVNHVNKCAVKTMVDANQYLNNSGLVLEKGVKYRVDFNEKQRWMDAGQQATPTGWEPAETGVAKFFRKMLARDTNVELFHLMGAIYGECEDGYYCGEEFPIKAGEPFEATASGEFCTFANDLPFMYWNNSEEIEIRISRVSDEACKGED